MRLGDPVSAFLFVLALEVSFVLIKSNNRIKDLGIYGHNSLYTAYTDDSSFFFHYSYNKKLENEKNFKNHIHKIETVLKILRMRNLTLEGKITILPNSTMTQLNKILKEFIWNHKKVKIKEKTLISNFDQGGLKDVDIPSKITSLQCSWVKRLFDKNFHEWKIIALFLIEKYFRKKNQISWIP